MNTTSQNPGSRFPFSSGPDAMDNRTLYVTLVAATGLAFVVILVIYYFLSGRNPLNRVGYGVLASVLPALGTLVVVKLTRLFVSWRGATVVYMILFALVVLIQAFGR